MSYWAAPMWASTRPRLMAETVSWLVSVFRTYQDTTGQKARFVRVAAIYKSQQLRNRKTTLEKLDRSGILRTRTLLRSVQAVGSIILRPILGRLHHQYARN